MSILLTGGTGKTSKCLTPILQDAKIPFIIASRKSEAGTSGGMPAVKFDWMDSSTWASVFQHGPVSAVYLVAPDGVSDEERNKAMNDFIDLAVKEHGVRRFVLLGGSTLEIGKHYTGKVWQRLADDNLEYCVLRCTWFMENFSQWQHLNTIKNEGKIYTACGNGRIPFVSAEDIAAVAFCALTDDKPHNTDYRVLGPELLTHDEIAAKLTTGLEREIVHIHCSGEEMVRRYMNLGLPEQSAKFMSMLEGMAANGVEDRMNDAVRQVTRKAPKSFDEWVQENKTAWQ